MSAAGTCAHPKNRRQPTGHGWFLCTKCGQKVRPKARHGSYAGYSRHQKTRAGAWYWPLKPLEEGGCGCKEAGTQTRREYERDPSNRKRHDMRTASRNTAMSRLRRIYPAEFARLYTQEVMTRGGRSDPRMFSVPAWEDLVAALVKTALGCDEAAALAKVRSGWADGREREFMRLLVRLRICLSDDGRRMLRGESLGSD